jgi:predicted lipoprotein with Yx(FWY)xxD motif
VGRLTAVAIAVVTIAAAAVAVLALTRSSTPAAPRAAAPAAPAPGAADEPSVRVARTKLGRILVNGQGRTLYLYVKDRGTKSACSRRCSQVWPPATVSGAPTAGPGVAAAKLTTTRGADHRRQLVYNGHPLYTLTADVRPGQINGEGFLGTWYVVSAAGNRIGKLTKSSSEY